MRKLIIAGATALSIFTATAPAHAQWATFDASNYAQALEQVKALQQQYQTMQQQLQTAQQTAQSIAHFPQNELNQLSQQFNTQALRNVLPNSSTVTNQLSGSSLSSAAQGYLNQNRAATPTGTDARATEINRSANSIANNQAMASDLYTSAGNHITALQGLEGQLATAPDAKAVADIQARISQEQAVLQAQQVQAQSLTMMQASAGRNEDQRFDEQRRSDWEKMLADAKAHGG